MILKKYIAEITDVSCTVFLLDDTPYKHNVLKITARDFKTGTSISNTCTFVSTDTELIGTVSGLTPNTTYTLTLSRSTGNTTQQGNFIFNDVAEFIIKTCTPSIAPVTELSITFNDLHNIAVSFNNTANDVYNKFTKGYRFCLLVDSVCVKESDSLITDSKKTVNLVRFIKDLSISPVATLKIGVQPWFEINGVKHYGTLATSSSFYLQNIFNPIRKLFIKESNKWIHCLFIKKR